MPYDICLYGTICLDRISTVEALPPLGGYVDIDSQMVAAGGEALNTAVALATWGVKVVIVGNAIGQDTAGDLLMHKFSEYPSIETRFLRRIASLPTPTCEVYVTPDGERTMFGTGFKEMSTEWLPHDAIAGCKAFSCDMNPGEASTQACIDAHEYGVPVVNMDMHTSEAACNASSIILTSYEQVGRIDDIPHLMKKAQEYFASYGCSVVLTAGDKGCVVLDRLAGEAVHLPAYIPPVVVDGTGSGDTFRAGLLYRWAVCGDTLLEACRFGSAVAALNIGAMGACAGVQPEAAIWEFMKSQG